MSKHSGTPSPWYALQNGRAWEIRHKEPHYTGIGDLIAKLPVLDKGPAHVEADAKLAAAAPAMLALLERIVEMPAVKSELEFLDRGIGTETPTRVWLEARTLIAAIKGGE